MMMCCASTAARQLLSLSKATGKASNGRPKTLAFSSGATLNLDAYQGGHAAARFLEGFLEGSFKEVLLRGVLRRHLVRVSVVTGVLRRVVRRGGVIECA